MRIETSAASASSSAVLINAKPDARMNDTAISMRVAALIAVSSFGRKWSSPPVTRL